MSDKSASRDSVRNEGRTHWEGCWREHKDCELYELRYLVDELIEFERAVEADECPDIDGILARARELRS